MHEAQKFDRNHQLVLYNPEPTTALAPTSPTIQDRCNSWHNKPELCGNCESLVFYFHGSLPVTGADAATVEFLSFSIQQVGHPFKSTKTSSLSRVKRKVQPLGTVDRSIEDTSKSVPFIYHKQKRNEEVQESTCSGKEE